MVGKAIWEKSNFTVRKLFWRRGKKKSKIFFLTNGFSDHFFPQLTFGKSLSSKILPRSMPLPPRSLRAFARAADTRARLCLPCCTISHVAGGLLKLSQLSTLSTLSKCKFAKFAKFTTFERRFTSRICCFGVQKVGMGRN